MSETGQKIFQAQQAQSEIADQGRLMNDNKLFSNPGMQELFKKMKDISLAGNIPVRSISSIAQSKGFLTPVFSVRVRNGSRKDIQLENNG